VHILEQHCPIEFIGILEGEIAAGSRGPAVGRFLYEDFVELGAALFFVRVIATPTWKNRYIIDLMRG
jgi:hypothetical protein